MSQGGRGGDSAAARQVGRWPRPCSPGNRKNGLPFFAWSASRGRPPPPPPPVSPLFTRNCRGAVSTSRVTFDLQRSPMQVPEGSCAAARVQSSTGFPAHRGSSSFYSSLHPPVPELRLYWAHILCVNPPCFFLVFLSGVFVTVQLLRSHFQFAPPLSFGASLITLVPLC